MKHGANFCPDLLMAGAGLEAAQRTVIRVEERQAREKPGVAELVNDWYN